MEKIDYWSLGNLGDKEPSEYLIIDGDNHSHWSKIGEWKYECGGSCAERAKEHIAKRSLIINPMNKMKITNLIKKILDNDTRKLVAAGFINGDLALTDEGVSELLGMLFLEKKKELVKIAEEKLADEKNCK